MAIRDFLAGKSAKERASIKGKEIAKVNFRGEYAEKTGIKIEITDIKEIEGGVEIFARAWKNDKQLGFGKDGSVEIERFRIFNPPILVDDPNGNIIREWKDSVTGELKQRKLREDPAEAIRQVIADNAKLVGKEDTNIIKGKIGNTTSTFYPDANPETTSVDGFVSTGNIDPSTWTTMRNHSGGSFSDSGVDDIIAFIRTSTSTNLWRQEYRAITGFDTSSIPDTDTID